MAENMKLKNMLAQSNDKETEEILEFLQTLDSYEKREFIGIMRGAKLVKVFQKTKQEVAV